MIIADHQYLFSGDVLFKGSIGRTDFPLSNHEDMLNTLEMIKDMNPNLKVYPGHEAPTTIKEELNSNPFLK